MSLLLMMMSLNLKCVIKDCCVHISCYLYSFVDNYYALYYCPNSYTCRLLLPVWLIVTLLRLFKRYLCLLFVSYPSFVLMCDHTTLITVISIDNCTSKFIFSVITRMAQNTMHGVRRLETKRCQAMKQQRRDRDPRQGIPIHQE